MKAGDTLSESDRAPAGGSETVVRFETTEDDYLAFTKHVLLRRWQTYAELASLLLVGPLLVVCSWLLSLVGDDVEWMAQVGLGLLVLNSLFVIYNFWSNPRSAARKVAARPGYLGEWVVALTPESLKYDTSAGDASYKWAALHGVERDAGTIYFYVRPGAGLFVPRRAFSDDAAFERFFVLAKSYLGAAATA